MTLTIPTAAGPLRVVVVQRGSVLLGAARLRRADLDVAIVVRVHAREIVQRLGELLRAGGTEQAIAIGAASKPRSARGDARKRRARNFRDGVRRMAQAVARARIVDKLRGAMRQITQSKIASTALRAVATGAGAAFAGPAGMAAARALVGPVVQPRRDASPTSTSPAPSAYAAGCRCPSPYQTGPRR